jgi:sulfate adenylyltransferase large subunit
MDLLRLITCGNVDDGKSTLLGRLLHDTKSIFEDQWAALQRISAERGSTEPNLAFITDGLRAERAQGITIDVAHRYFSTPRRKFILADCPGHLEFTRNLVTGASNAQVALLLVDIQRGITEQTRRHAFLASLLRVRHLIVCVNKLDLVGYREDVFARVREEFMAFAERLEGIDVQFVPLSALHGDNVVEKSVRMPWFAGTPLLYALENIYVRNEANLIDARFPVQLVLESGGTTLLAGRIASGAIRTGEELVHLPSGQLVRVVELRGPDGAIDEARHPFSVTLQVEGAVAISRGDMLARPHNQPRAMADFDAMICWLDSRALQLGRRYVFRHTTREVAGSVSEIRYALDVNTLHRRASEGGLQANAIARVVCKLDEPIFGDPYRRNRETGGLLIIDAETHATAGAALIL